MNLHNRYADDEIRRLREEELSARAARRQRLGPPPTPPQRRSSMVARLALSVWPAARVRAGRSAAGMAPRALRSRR